MTQAQNDKPVREVPHYVAGQTPGPPSWMPPAPPAYLWGSAGSAMAVPKLWTTFWITLFFGLFGLIPAVIHSNRARALGAPVANYWYTFGGTYAASLVIGFLVLKAVGVGLG